MNVLIAEDSAVSRLMLEKHLRKWGYDIVATEDGYQALEQLSRPDSPSLAILDWMMPGMDGIDVCRKVRRQTDRPFLYIIMLTAKGDKEDIIQGLEAGADDYVMKPFDPAELRSRVGVGEKMVAVHRLLESKISDLRSAEEALSQSVSRYTAMIDTVPALMYLKDADGRYVEVNEAFCNATGRSKEEILGKTSTDVFPPEIANTYTEEDHTVLSRGERLLLEEVRHVDPKGNEKWYTTTKMPLKESDDTTVGVVGLAQDVTEQRNSRQRLIQSDKLAGIGTLAAGVAHEINNPIGFIMSNLGVMDRYLKKIREYVDSLGDGAPEGIDDLKEILPDFADAVSESVEGATRVRDIVADLKSFSRVDRAEKESADINDGIKRALNVVWNELKYKAEVEQDLGDIPDLFCMPNQLNQVFMNLLLNASQAIEDQPGLIRVRTWADSQNVYVSIKDNGKGIAEPDLKRIFEPFFTTKEIGRGTGLGLSLAYDTIAKHNGRIDVRSDVGVGTEFTITLPLAGLEQESLVPSPAAT